MLTSLVDAVQDREVVRGLTHSFYRYPARFPPRLARAIIEGFTDPGDFVLDPFVGGGTTLVEATALGRRAVGLDINSLAVFVTNAKTAVLSEQAIGRIADWAGTLPSRLNMRHPVVHDPRWHQSGYDKNVTGRRYWRIRKAIELFLQEIPALPEPKQRGFARCVLLRTAQWALDAREQVPSIEEFRQKLSTFLTEMITASQEYGEIVSNWASRLGRRPTSLSVCLQRSAVGLDQEPMIRRHGAPRLVLTSPPYPGVHVLYHRWQVAGRRETPIPFMIAGCLDGKGAAYYTFGDRKTHVRERYFANLRLVFSSVARVADSRTVIAQVVGFSSPESQLPRFLDALRGVGLEELFLDIPGVKKDGRLWRSVPNRRWYVRCGSQRVKAHEVVLFHRKRIQGRPL